MGSGGARALVLGAALLLGAAPQSPSFAEEPLPIPHLLRNARVVVAPGRVIDKATVLVEGGLIRAVTAQTDALPVSGPAGAREWDFEGLTIYPGLIEPYHERAWSPPAPDAEKDVPDTGHSNAMVGPERSVLQAKYDEGEIKKLRQAGYGIALAVPSDGVFRGRGALQLLHDGSLRKNLLRESGPQLVALQTQGSYPGSTMGSVALLRQVVAEARWYERALALYAKNPAQPRPAFDLSLTALSGVVGGKESVWFVARNAQDAQRGAALLRELQLEGVLIGQGDEYQWLDELRATGRSFVVDVDFPAKPKVKDENDLDTSLETLRFWDEAPGNLAALAGAGVETAVTTRSLANPSEVHAHLAAAIERGLTADQALAAVTTTPARLLAISDRAGTVEVGKLANLVVVEGELFVEKPKIREVWIEGRRYELEKIAPPEIAPQGEWALDVDAGGQQIAVTMSIRGPIDALEANLTAMGQNMVASAVQVSGKTVIVTVNNPSVGGEFTFRMQVDGERGSGSGDSPQGSFSFTGTRTSAPPEPESRVLGLGLGTTTGSADELAIDGEQR